MIDKLEEIFKKQKELQEKLGNKDILFNQQYMNINFLALTCEVMEAMQETKWKNPNDVKYGWKQTQELNKDKLREELIDCFHFYINLCLAADLTANDLYQAYIDKNKLNHKRKDNGY